jgi:hypothetical protein
MPFTTGPKIFANVPQTQLQAPNLLLKPAGLLRRRGRPEEISSQQLSSQKYQSGKASTQ